jgi:integrase
MAIHRRRLTEPTIKRLRPPKAGRLEVGDDIVPGLVVRVTPSGLRSFSVIYKVPGEGGVSPTGRLLAGRQHRITLGQHPALSIAKAREEARKILEVVSEGRDPRPERRQQNLIRHTNTVEAVTRRFIEQDAKRTVASWRNIQRCLALHVLPGLGDRPIRDVRRADVHSILDALVAEERVGAARETRKHLHRLFEFALDREIVTDNPVHGMKRRDLAPNDDAGRALDDAELCAVWAGTVALGYPMGPMLQLLILTGQRRGEWANSTRSEISFDLRTLEIPAARHKSGRDHVVPLSGPAWEIVEALPVLEGDCLFSTRAGHVPVSGFSKAKRQLDELALATLRRDEPDATLPRYRIHDLRVTCETRLADLGATREVRDAILGHAKPGLQRTYNKHDYMDEKRAALADYAEHVLGVVS